MPKQGVDQVKNKCLSIDEFGTEFKFRLPDGRTKHKTLIGVFMTLILVGAIIFFVLVRLDDLRQPPIIADHKESDHYDIDTVFKSEEEKYKFAFAITDFDDGKPLEEDQSLFGIMKAQAVTWGLPGQVPGYFDEVLETEPCTLE